MRKMQMKEKDQRRSVGIKSVSIKVPVKAEEP